MAAPHREAVQKQIQQDWANREYIEVITVSIKKITDFLNSFDLSCRSKLAVLNEKLTTLERKIDYLEACWVNIIFNKVDEDRRRQFGPDRTCAEWLLRNGAAVKFTTTDEFLHDYNSLPIEGTPLHIKEVDATESSIMHYGFDHFSGCRSIDSITLDKCYYLQDEALPQLSVLRDTLRFLQVSSCRNITARGLEGLYSLGSLDRLVMFDLPYVKDVDGVTKGLRERLPGCKVTFKTDFSK